MKQLLDNLPVGILVLQGIEPYRVIYANEPFQKATGYSEEELTGMDLSNSDCVHPKDQRIIPVAARQAENQGNTEEFELRIRNRRGEYLWFVFRIQYLVYEKEGPRFMVTLWNIQERKAMEEELHVQMERHKLVEQITGDMSLDYDVASGEILIPRKYLTMRGMADKVEYFTNLSEFCQFLYSKDVGLVMDTLEEASRQEKKGNVEFRLNVAGRPGERRYAWYHLTYKSIPDLNGEIIRVVGRMRDVDQEKIRHNQLSERVRRDAMTGLLNKTSVRDEIEACVLEEPDKVHAMFLIDVDNFKEVNDTFGHLYGDTVLISIAEKISSVFHKTDLIGRVGGDEFLVWMRDTDDSVACKRAEQLCDSLHQEYPGEQQSVTISCSIGISFFDRDGSGYDELFERADYAMYQAKDSGKNCYHVADARSYVEGFRRETGRSREEEYGIVHFQDENFLSAAFTLLAHARDWGGSLNLLLERIGKRYDLDMVVVSESKSRQESYTAANGWLRKQGILKGEQCRIFRDWDVFLTDFDERGLRWVDNCQAVWRKLGEETEEPKVKALVHCRFRCQNGKKGILTFGNLERTRKWSEFEKETFLEISKIVSVFVSLKQGQQRDRDEIRQLKISDPLTGLLNEEQFRQRGQELINRRDPKLQYAVVFTDIKDFSYINENFGVEAGNEILKKFAKLIVVPDTMISCRLYSDLFLTLVWDEDQDTIRQNVEKTFYRFSSEQQKKYPQSNLQLVTGIYFIEPEQTDFEIAIENANLTRKRAKKHQGGEACSIYTKDLRKQRDLENRIIAEFWEAYREELFQVYIQPKFLLKTMEADGGEALVRWQPKDRSMVYPDEFIPVLERFGYVVDLDFYVLEHMLMYMAKWKKEGRKLCRLSVNFSRKHFEGKGIYRQVCRMADQYGIEHKYIEIEITESFLQEGTEQIKQEMEHLREAGFVVAIDDFGKGYSSLSMLHDVPADVVKIDRSFLMKRDIKKEREYIERMGALIRSVKEEVVFEGVENEEQRRYLVECGFEYGQGYLFEQPVPAQVFEEKYMN